MKVYQLYRLFFLLCFTAGIVCAGCGNGAGDRHGNDSNNILGAGSTFDNPLFSKLFAEYNKLTGLKVNYQSIGSGGGIQQLTAKTVDFGATDAFLNEQQDSAMSAAAINIPVTVGAVVISYNLPGITDTLLLTPELLSNIFLGNIKRWNDPAIIAVNPTIKLPNTGIVITHRSDGSGTTNIFSTYLWKVSDEWKRKVGRGSFIDWPLGLGGKGNEGVAGYLKQIPGAIGYIELAYAVMNKMPFAKIKNKAGHFVAPSIAGVTAAANVNLPADSKISLTDTDAPDGYPISGFSWILLYREQKYANRKLEKVGKLVHLVHWMIRDGQQYSAPLYYAPLSASAVSRGEALLQSVTYGGKPVLVPDSTIKQVGIISKKEMN